MAAIESGPAGSLGSLVPAGPDPTLSVGTAGLTLARNGGEGPAVRVAAPDGPGGLGNVVSADVGANHRRATSDSVQVSAGLTRFVRQQIGGSPSVDTAAIVTTAPFRGRMGRGLRPGTGDGAGRGLGGPPPQTEDTVEMGLAFLARQQSPEGHWGLRVVGDEDVTLVSDTAATALSLLAFQGAGYNHREHRYARVLNAGLNYLLKYQQADGNLFRPIDEESNRTVALYSHGLATLALCEAYGMTQDPTLKEPAQRALDYIVKSQHPDRGGWRYVPNRESDLSVTGWMMMALKSGAYAGLNVSDGTFQKIVGWLDKSQASTQEPHLYRYNPLAPDTDEQRHGRAPSKTMTSVGLLMRLYSGWRRDNANMVRGAEYLAKNPPRIGTHDDPQRDTYYWYYATQVMFHMGGNYWKQWNDRLHPLLVDSQIRQGPMAGSWDPRQPVPDRWAPHAGRLYVTTMNLLSLEIYYRHLPLYEDSLK